jgi:NADH dehydrogenase (ubiquinone) 1 alpha subcomplex subunit 2
VNEYDSMVIRKGLVLTDVLRELRVHLSQTHPASEGLRQFIRQHYLLLKKEHPTLPILIRECSDVDPRVYARYDYGKEVSVDLSYLAVEQIQKEISKLISTSPS